MTPFLVTVSIAFGFGFWLVALAIVEDVPRLAPLPYRTNATPVYVGRTTPTPLSFVSVERPVRWAEPCHQARYLSAMGCATVQPYPQH